MGLTLTIEELSQIKRNTERVFIKREHQHTSLNKLGSTKDMEDSNELLLYTYLFEDVCNPEEHSGYLELISNRDVFRIHNRVLQIESNI